MEIWQIVLGIFGVIFLLCRTGDSNLDVVDYEPIKKPWEDEELGCFAKRRDYIPETPEQRQRRIDLHPNNRNLKDGDLKHDWDTVDEDPETGWDFHWIREQREKGRNI